MRQEVILLMLLDAKNRFHSDAFIAAGDQDSARAKAQNVLFPVLNRQNARNFVLVHNHPGDTTNPSQGDISFTGLIKVAAEYFEVNMLDHIIITRDRYYSFAAKGTFVPFSKRRNRKQPKQY